MLPMDKSLRAVERSAVSRYGVAVLASLVMLGTRMALDPILAEQAPDLKLPKVSGLEVLRRIRTENRTRLAPVVVLTSSSEQKHILKCYRDGANSYVRKPVELERFVEIMRHVSAYWLEISESPVGLA